MQRFALLLELPAAWASPWRACNMSKMSKRQKLIRSKVESTRSYSVDEAVSLLVELGQSVKFKESVDVAFNLGVDARKSDQVVRSSTVLPHGTGKTVRVAVFTQGANRSEEHTSELQSRPHLVCRLLLEKKKKNKIKH